ncbi:FIG00003370: Multicopper polyphenol oxidase [Olavius sp. associated proteobacterium Delta 1]|nr:FIG00003370: Multicopper polyphenol oxidase [Olavius sp. associated proteobacterium Delta 1]
MILTTDNGTPFYRFENLAACADIGHGIFTRNAGCSPPPFNSLNVGHGIGDDDSRVETNRRTIGRCFRGAELVYARQVHGRQVIILADYPGGQGATPHPAAPVVGDAIVTDQRQKYLVIQVADCQSVLLYEPVRQAVANLHCGWRGSVQNIIGRTVETMVLHFDCSPANIIAGIGPSLGPCCAEFINYKAEIPPALWGYKDSTDHFDFWSISRDQMVQAGVAPENIESSRICTRCRADEFFSYRSEKTTGRFAAVIGLR